MGAKAKQQKFDELDTFPNVFQNRDYLKATLENNKNEVVQMAGNWNKIYFKNDAPLVLELACGKGEYSLGLGELYPDKNLIGFDLKGNRIWKGAKQALAEERKNIAFVRSKIELIPNYFAEGEVDEIWVLFADPYPRKSDANRRLTSPFFLNLYKKILKKGGIVHFKTDAVDLFNYSCEVAESDVTKEVLEIDRDIYANGKNTEGPLAIKTFYEKMHLDKGKKIQYLKFILH